MGGRRKERLGGRKERMDGRKERGGGRKEKIKGGRKETRGGRREKRGVKNEKRGGRREKGPPLSTLSLECECRTPPDICPPHHYKIGMKGQKAPPLRYTNKRQIDPTSKRNRKKK